MVVHPAVVAAFAFTGVVLVGWKLYEEYQERKMYEQYQRHRARYEQEFNSEQYYNRFHRNNNDFDFDDDRDDYTSTNYVRKRKPFTDNTDIEKKKSTEEEEEGQDQYELTDLESSIAERKRRLMAEQAFLDHEEEILRNRRDAIMRNSTSSIPLSNTRSISSNSSSDSEDDRHSLQSHMANFDPFVDHFQENSSQVSDKSSVKYSITEISNHEESNHVESNSDSTETILVDNSHPQASMNNSTELYYPSANLFTPSTSTATSVSGENMTSPSINRVSDSEESWDAVSENEWNHSSANESDNEFSSHFSVASISDDDTRLRL